MPVEAIIGDCAGRVWQMLSEKGPQSPAAIARTLGMKSAEVDRAIGWLAREGKLAFQEGRRGALKVQLR